MKVLIGTPIHQMKDYAMEKWLANVAKLQKKTPADLLLVDNSPNLSYMKKVKNYCAKYAVKNYEIIHIKFDQGMNDAQREERVERAQEAIRQTILSKDYDAWFSWECDQLIPPDALKKLIGLIKGGIWIVAHNSWMRQDPTSVNFDMGCTLVKRECLKKYGFLRKNGSARWRGDNTMYNMRVFKKGGNYAEVSGVINPIRHLDNGDRF